MQIVLVLIILAAAVLVALGAVLVGALIFGGVLLSTRRARVLVPVFLIIVPATVLGSLAGGVIVGYLAIRANENLVFLGPLGGLILGGLAGLAVGLAAALFWWWRASRRARGPNETVERTAGVPPCLLL